MRLPRVVHTSSFQLTLLYAALFTTSALVLFAVVYWSTAFYMTSQLDAAIDSDLTELQIELPAGGAAGLARMIGERVHDMPNGPMLYLLETPDGRILAGNLPALAIRAGTLDLALPAPRRRNRRVYAHGVLLADGGYLLVGADASAREEMRELILRAFGWSFAVTLLLAFGGGLLVSGRLLRRVEAISRAAREIIAGNLARRLPMRGADDEFDHLASSLNTMLERLETSIEAIRQVSNDIAHDLRTPLTRLRQRLELAGLRAASAAELRRAITGSIAEVDAVLETFGALLRIAQIEGGRPRAGFASVDLTELLLAVAEIYQSAADERGQTLATDIAPGLRVEGDRELLAQMLGNLIENGVRHAPPQAALAATAKSGPDGIDITIADNGPGIPASQHEHVFRRFYRLEASRTTPGNGLGLSLVRAVAGLHRIDIELADNMPGLRVRLRLPHPAPRNGAAAEEAPAAALPRPLGDPQPAIPG